MSFVTYDPNEQFQENQIQESFIVAKFTEPKNDILNKLFQESQILYGDD